MSRRPSHLKHPSNWLPVVIAGGIVGAAALAQTRPSGPSGPSAAAGYDYAGVGASLVRVERDTGRVEILEQRDSPGLPLTVENNRAWTWRRVRVDERPDRVGRGAGERETERPQGFGGRFGESDE